MFMEIKTIKKIKNLKGKTIFLRVDFNVSLDKGKIKDDYRIKAALKTINFLADKGARIILASHLGDPKGKVLKEYSLYPVALRLRRLLKRPLKFPGELNGLKVKKALLKLLPGEILLLENLRFDKRELEDDKEFARELASLADIYVNEAFSVSHRQQASVSAIKNYLPAYAGLLLEEEIKALNKIKEPKKPLVVIMGGAKIKTKAPLIKKLEKKATKVLLGGALANNFWKYQKMEIGSSLYDADSLDEVENFFTNGKIKTKIVLPIDVVVLNTKKQLRLCRPQEVKKDEAIFDIGPETISLYAKYIKDAQTLVWNGPLGKFEDNHFKQGTLSIARLVAARSQGKAYGLVGGGETVAALNLSKMGEYVDFISTAGGAMLSYLGGEKMPGLEKIIITAKKR